MTVGSSRVVHPLNASSTDFEIDFASARGSFPWAPAMTVVVDLRAEEEKEESSPSHQAERCRRGRQSRRRRRDARKKVWCSHGGVWSGGPSSSRHRTLSGRGCQAEHREDEQVAGHVRCGANRPRKSEDEPFWEAVFFCFFSGESFTSFAEAHLAFSKLA